MKLYRLYFLISALILVNLVYGPLVRATDSGLACPDWPLCHGKVSPEWTFPVFMEVGHRYYSGMIGLFVLFGFVWIMKSSDLRRKYGVFSFLSLFFLGTQVALGALTVTKLLDPATVNLHLLNALVLLAFCLLIAFKDKLQIEGWDFQKKGKILLPLTMFFVAYQLYLGGKVSSNYAGLACPDFPTCYGSWMPEMIGTVRLQMEHRLIGYFVACFVMFTTAYSIFKFEDRIVKSYLKIATYLIIFQVLLGALNVIYHIPKPITALHTLNGACVFLSCYIASIYNFRKKNEINT